MYNKIFTKILDSSIWLEPDATRIVWLTCIAAMDEDGFCGFASIANLAHRANVPLDAATLAVATLEGPDPNSSDPEHDGRRIERVAGGWLVLNAEKYRDIVTRAVSRERTRLRVARHRKKRDDGNADVTEPNVPVTQSVSVSGSGSEAVSEATTTKKPLTPRPTTYGRITLHAWQLHALIDALGPHAASFDLDAWVMNLSALADARQLVLTRSTLWPWVQAELVAECQRRGLTVATADQATPHLGKQSTRLLAAVQNIARRERGGLE